MASRGRDEAPNGARPPGGVGAQEAVGSSAVSDRQAWGDAHGARDGAGGGEAALHSRAATKARRRSSRAGGKKREEARARRREGGSGGGGDGLRSAGGEKRGRVKTTTAAFGSGRGKARVSVRVSRSAAIRVRKVRDGGPGSAHGSGERSRGVAARAAHERAGCGRAGAEKWRRGMHDANARLWGLESGWHASVWKGVEKKEGYLEGRKEGEKGRGRHANVRPPRAFGERETRRNVRLRRERCCRLGEREEEAKCERGARREEGRG